MIRDDVKTAHDTLIAKYPDADKDFMCKFMKLMPDVAIEVFDIYEEYKEYGCHIATEKLYNKFITKLPKVKWSYDDIMSVANIDFDTVNYYEYDFAFLMNYLYAIFSDKITETSYYIFMTRKLLENTLMDKPDDTAYHIAEKLL